MGSRSLTVASCSVEPALAGKLTKGPSADASIGARSRSGSVTGSRTNPQVHD